MSNETPMFPAPRARAPGGELYGPRLVEAMAFAAESFRFTERKSTGVPYLTHLLSVAALVGEGGGDEDQIIAALLHDYLEDIPGASGEELERRFGARVRGLVEGLSDSQGHPKPPWRERKEAYLAHLEHARADLKLVSTADKLHNARSIARDQRATGDAVFGRFTGGKDGTLWYYREVHRALTHRYDHWLLGELHIEVSEVHRLAGVSWRG